MPYSESKEIQQDRAIAANYDSIVNKPIRSGQMGTAQTTPTGPITLLFNEIWVDQGGITYNAGTGEFTVPEDGVYRITLNPLKADSASTAYVLIGINNLTPGAAAHRGSCFTNDPSYDAMCLDSVVDLTSGDKISFYLQQGQVFNTSGSRYNQYTIEKIN